jgi:hypothetical protein
MPSVPPGTRQPRIESRPPHRDHPDATRVNQDSIASQNLDQTLTARVADSTDHYQLSMFGSAHEQGSGFTHPTPWSSGSNQRSAAFLLLPAIHGGVRLLAARLGCSRCGYTYEPARVVCHGIRISSRPVTDRLPPVPHLPDYLTPTMRKMRACSA